MLAIENLAVIGDELVLLWSDGLESYLALADLRRACPCAACQGEPDALGRVLKPQVTLGEKSSQLTRMEHVGGYALQLFWADGHSTGIYPYQLLRELAAAG